MTSDIEGRRARDVDAGVLRPSALQRARAFQEQLARRSARALTPSAGGFAVLDGRYPFSYEHNQLYVTSPVDAAALAADAERLLGHLRHRQITVLDEAVGLALAPGMAAAGYERQRFVVMVLDGEPDRTSTPGVRAERVSDAAMRVALLESWRRVLPAASAESIQQLADRRSATAAACDLTNHAVLDGSRIVSRCHLYRLGTVAQVEDVETVPEWRGRGLARAVVLDAVGTARDAGCDLVFLVADRDDWPQLLYERLGFVAAGGLVSFLRVPGIRRQR